MTYIIGILLFASSLCFADESPTPEPSVTPPQAPIAQVESSDQPTDKGTAPKADEPKIRRWYVNGTVGYGSTDSDREHKFITGGARIGVGLSRKEKNIFSLGASIQAIEENYVLAGATAKESIAYFGLEILLRRLFGSGVYLGATAGVSALNGEITVGGTTYTATASSSTYGPILGYEFRLSDRFGINLDLRDLNIQAGIATISGLPGTYPYSATSALLGQVGFIFRW